MRAEEMRGSSVRFDYSGNMASGKISIMFLQSRPEFYLRDKIDDQISTRNRFNSAAKYRSTVFYSSFLHGVLHVAA